MQEKVITDNQLDWIRERYALSLDRIRQIAGERLPFDGYDDYFRQQAALIIQICELSGQVIRGGWQGMDLADLKAINGHLYADILGEAYARSYTNPRHAAAVFGTEMGRQLCRLACEIRSLIPLAFRKRLSEMTAIMELFVEVYNCFETHVPETRQVRDILYWYISDYSDQTVTLRIRERLDPGLNFYKRIIMEADPGDLRYLYRYGMYISEDELETARCLAALEEDKIEEMARILVDGYVRGFEVYRIEPPMGRNVVLRAHVGFERVLRAVIRRFKDLDMETIIYGEAIHCINGGERMGLVSTPANPQYDHDHRLDAAFYLDKALRERVRALTRSAYSHYADLAKNYAGPAVMLVFGGESFEPAALDEALTPGKKQSDYMRRLIAGQSAVANKAMDAEKNSYAMIAWPLPSACRRAGGSYRQLLEETIRLNALDNDRYRQIHQIMIDACDGAAYMHVLGAGENHTDIRVSLQPLHDPRHETDFENCCADVNIPVGEIFTSPQLAGTEGLLEVSGVYMSGIYYKKLRLRFADGWITGYDCSNYENEAQDKAFVKANLLKSYDALPMSEFAIGTNTEAYAMARRHQVSDLLPVLIAEKTGPHFAVGDTCYAHIEDMKVYNQDGKEIIARENEWSALRERYPEKAYFSTHTDITIPYDEIALIEAVFADGRHVPVIRDGRFCLPGTEQLNEPLDALSEEQGGAGLS